MSLGTCCSQRVLLLLGLQVHQISPLAEIQLLLSASFAKMAIAPMPIRYTHKFIFFYTNLRLYMVHVCQYTVVNTCEYCKQTRQGIRMEKWVQLAPPMGLADFITADATFDQLATADDNAEEERTIKADVLARYCERICSKSAPGAAKVGGVRFGRGGDSAERMIRRHPACLHALEQVSLRSSQNDPPTKAGAALKLFLPLLLAHACSGPEH